MRNIYIKTFVGLYFLVFVSFFATYGVCKDTDKTIQLPVNDESQNIVQKILPIKNSSFEVSDNTTERERIPPWQYYGGAKPQKLSRDGFHGDKAMRLERGFVRQRIKIDPEDVGKPVTIALHAKGSGELTFWFLPLKKEQEKFVNTYDKGWKGRQARFPLSAEYLPYSFTFEHIPDKTEFLEIHFGSYSPIDVFFDDVRVTIGRSMPQGQPEQNVTLPDGIRLVDIAPYARIRTNPYGTLVRRMVDSIAGTGVSLEKHPFVKTHAYEFLYDQSVEIAKIRFTLPSQSFIIRGDTTGDGRYDKVLSFEPEYQKIGYWGQQEWIWYEKVIWPSVKVHSVKLVNFSQQKNNAVFEFKLMAISDSIAPGLIKRIELATGVPVLTAGRQLPIPRVQEEQRFLQGFHVEPWMFNMPGWLKQDPRPPLKDWPPFKEMIGQLQRMHCNLVWIFPPRTWVPVKGRKGTYPYDVMWPSKFFKWSQPEHLLQEFSEAMHKEGFKVFAQYRFPNWQKQVRPDGDEESPVIDWYRRTFFTGSAVEMALEGIDGVPVCLDEEYFGGVRYPGQFFKIQDETTTNDEAELKRIRRQNLKVAANRDGFSKRWDTDFFPEKLEDSELFRQWVVYYYEQIGAHFNQTAKAVKKVHPEIATVANIVNGEQFNDRYHYGWAYDIFGHRADIDYFGTDPYHTREASSLGYYSPSKITKSLIAANKKRSAIVTLNFPWGQSRKKHPLTYEVHPPISTIGSVLGPLMQGGKSFAFWRYNYAFLEGYDKYVEQAFAMLDAFASWGGKDAAVPKNIAVLRSRASEDWWQLKVRMGEHQKNRVDETMGFEFDKWLEEFLLTRGYPYELYYLDQPEGFHHLSDFPLIILPFPYSISRESFAEIKHALKNGSKVLLLSKQGETDEIGSEYETPLFADLIRQQQITFIAEDIRDVGHFPNFLEKMDKLIDNLLGSRERFQVKTNNFDVQIGWLEKNTNELFVILVNWDDRESLVDLGVIFSDKKLPVVIGKTAPIKYRILRRNLTGVNEMELHGNSRLTTADLKKFRLRLSPGEAQILYISPDITSD